MNNDIDLTNQMRRLAAALPHEAGTHVERDLLIAFRARHPRRKPRWIVALTAAALVCIVFFAGSHIFRRPPRVANSVYGIPGFIPLPYSESGVPIESAVVIRVQMRSSELASMGVAVPASPSILKFKADLLVAQDGVPRAVRLVESLP